MFQKLGEAKNSFFKEAGELHSNLGVEWTPAPQLESFWEHDEKIKSWRIIYLSNSPNFNILTT